MLIIQSELCNKIKQTAIVINQLCQMLIRVCTSFEKAYLRYCLKNVRQQTSHNQKTEKYSKVITLSFPSTTYLSANSLIKFSFATINKSGQYNKMIIELGRSFNNSKQFMSYFKNNHQEFNMVNYCTYLKYLIRFKFYPNSEIAEVHKKCHDYIYRNLAKLPFRTFCIYLQIISQDEYLPQNFITPQKSDLITQFIIANFEMFNIQQCAKSLRYLKKILNQAEWKKQWQKLSSRISLAKFLSINQENGIGQYFTKYEGSLNQLLYLYDALDNKPVELHKDIEADRVKVNEKIRSALFGISSIIQEKMQFGKNLYGLPAMYAFLRKHTKNISNFQYIQSIINNVLVDLKQSVRVKINQMNDLTSLLQILRLSPDTNILVNNDFVLKLIEDFLMKKRKKIPASQKFDYNQMIKELGIQFQESQQKVKEEQSQKSQQEYYIEDMKCAQINIIMSFYCYFNCWNPIIFSLLEETFFCLLNNNNSKKSQMNVRNISLYCKERSKVGLNMLTKLSKMINQEQGPSFQKNRVSISIRMQTVKKSHKEFIERIADHLQHHPRQYKQAGAATILKSCQTLNIQSRKLKKRLAQLQQTLAKQSSE